MEIISDIKLKLNSGKEIELTNEEYQELKDHFKVIQVIKEKEYIPSYDPWNINDDKRWFVVYPNLPKYEYYDDSTVTVGSSFITNI